MNTQTMNFREHFDGADAMTGLLMEKRRKLKTLPSVAAAIEAELKDTPPTAAAEAMGELSRAAAEISGATARGFFVPWAELATRDLNMTTPSQGGYLTTSAMASEMIGALRPHSVALAAGATFIPMSNAGSLTYPRLTNGATVGWLDESGSFAAVGPDFDQVVVAPRTIAATITVSRRLLAMGAIKAGGIEKVVRAELLAAITSELDRVILAGSDVAPEPGGILTNADVDVIAIGANGGTPTWATITDMEHAVGLNSGDLGLPTWAINSATRRKLRRTERASGSGFIMEGGQIAGHPAVVSEHLPGDLTKGSGTGLSAAIYGDFSAVLVPVWGPGIDIIVDRYTLAVQGMVRVTALLDVGVALRHATRFVVCKDIVTT